MENGEIMTDIFGKWDDKLKEIEKEEKIEKKEKRKDGDIPSVGLGRKEQWMVSAKMLSRFIRDWTLFMAKMTSTHEGEFVKNLEEQFSSLLEIYEVEENIRKLGFKIDEIDKEVMESWKEGLNEEPE